MKPNFLILGAAKSGTTSLYHYLGQHPDVYFSEPKEPLFFEAEYDRGLEFYAQRYFRGWAGERAVGDARVYNLYLPYVAERVRSSLPDARLVAILRDPTARALSHWWHRYSRRLERLPFPDAVRRNLEDLAGGPRFTGARGAAAWRRGLHRRTNGTRHRVYVDPGYYAEQLERYRARFPPGQLRVFLYDDLVRDPQAVVRELWKFLGVDASAELVDASPQNVARDTVMGFASSRLVRAHRALGFTERLPSALKSRVRKLLRERPAERPPLDAATERLLRDHFREPNRRLSGLLDRDVSAWDRGERVA